MAEIHHSGQKQPPSGLSRLAAAALLILLVCGFYWKLLLTNQFTWLYGGDITAQVLPWLQVQAREWQAGRVPLWTSHSWYGQPLIGQTQPGVAYPLNWLLFATPLRDGFLKTGWLNWYFVVMHLVGAWFAYLLARDLGCRRMAAVFAGCAFTLLGWMGQTEWPQMLNGAGWTPLVLLFTFRICRGRSIWTSAFYGGLCFGMTWLGGHHLAPTFLALACGGILLWNGVRDMRRLAAAALFFVIGGCAGAAQILPSYEYGRDAIRWVGTTDPIGWDQKIPWTVHREFRARPADLLGIVFPGMNSHCTLYLGVVTFSLALSGVWLWRRRREARWLAAMGGLAVVFALVENSPLHGWLYSLVPMVEKGRNPSGAVYLMELAAAILAAMALNRLGRDPAAIGRAARWLLWFGVGIFGLRAAWALTHEYGPLKEDRTLITAVCALALAWLLTSVRKRRAGLVAAALCATLLMVTEASNENSFFLPAYVEKDRVALRTAMSEHDDIARFLRSQPGFPRTVVDDTKIHYNFGDWHGLDTTGGYLVSVTTQLFRSGMVGPLGYRFTGSAFLVSDKPSGNHTVDVFTGKSGLKVFKDPEALPRAFAVHELLEWLPVHTAEMMNHHYRERLSQAAFVTGPPPRLESCPDRPSQARLTLHHPSNVRIEAKMGCRGMVVLTDTHFPGWKATVDGVETPILEVDGAFRGVVVGAGSHRIEMVYRPVSVLAGAAMTGMTWLGGAVLFVFNRRRRKAPRLLT
ncbi:MAG TPA: hypothetical protein PKJ41_02330 [Bryobacteraceae bacterium]|nr:hypothetical protein [Bryobacteraceae bacterium]HPT28624.1 hypothetical protein [Bryobacteraceae bacterium]